MRLRHYKCYQCGKYKEEEGFYSLHSNESDTNWNLCSLTCLTEFVWSARERQPKLSKSKPVCTCGMGPHGDEICDACRK